LIAAALIVSGCGKKGPPLAPNSRIPEAVQQIAVRRVGNDMYLSFAVPAHNDDKTRPGVTRRIDVFGYTGFSAPPPARFLDGAVLIASVPVAPAPPLEAPLPLPGIVQMTTEGAAHGSLVRLVDRLDPSELVDKPLPPPAAVRGRAAVPAPLPRTPPAVNPVLRRFYMAIAWSDRNLPSAASQIAELPLVSLPEPPPFVRAGLAPPVAGPHILVEWDPSGGLFGFILDREVPIEPSPVDVAPRVAGVGTPAAPGGPTRYNVYRQVAPDPLALPAPAAAPSPFAVDQPVPLNPAPLDAFEFRDPVELDERERCYTVRPVRGVGPAQIEGEPSAPVCERPVDIYGPAPPRGLFVVAGEGSLTLTWDPNEDADLGGYLVLRREAGGATLLSLFDVPIVDTQYTDRTVTAGVRYEYVVVAVDTRLPVPNRSEPSNAAEEQAR
jgi:hypothetical protein